MDRKMGEGGTRTQEDVEAAFFSFRFFSALKKKKNEEERRKKKTINLVPSRSCFAYHFRDS